MGSAYALRDFGVTWMSESEGRFFSDRIIKAWGRSNGRRRRKGWNAEMALDAGLKSLDTPFWQNPWQQNHSGTTDGQDLHGLKKRRAVLGQAKLAMAFRIPSQASLHGILKAHRSLCCSNGLALSRRNCWEKMRGCAWPPSGDMLWKSICKPACECLL